MISACKMQEGISGLPHLLTGHRKLSKMHEMTLESDCLARGNLETNTITITPETARHVAETSPWVSLLCCCPPQYLFPTK